MDTDRCFFEALQQRSGVPAHTSKDLDQINMSLALSIQTWLRKHGRAPKPKLTEAQKRELLECFELMDADGSGAIDAEELQSAFKMLGVQISRREIQQLMDEVDRDGSGECEYSEFVEILTSALQKLSSEQEELTGRSQAPSLPFDLMATAYRRKRLIEGLTSGDPDMQEQVQQMADNLAALSMEADNGATAEPATPSPLPPNSPRSPASDLFTPEEIRVIRALMPRKVLRRTADSGLSVLLPHDTPAQAPDALKLRPGPPVPSCFTAEPLRRQTYPYAFFSGRSLLPQPNRRRQANPLAPPAALRSRQQ